MGEVNTDKRHRLEGTFSLKTCFQKVKLAKTLKETYAMLVRAHEDQAFPMKCVCTSGSSAFEKAEKVFLTKPVTRPATSVSDINIERESEEINYERPSINCGHDYCTQYLRMRNTWVIDTVGPQYSQQGSCFFCS
ncbi:hypothetical protein TNCV_4986901 [Trichonephila clavipes]|nr:hypothetical protein TNCV_4986901 [Trichonephila clavipes]